VTLPTETVSARLVWGAPTVTGAWWDTGVSMTTAAVRATVRETAIPSRDTACPGESYIYTHTHIYDIYNIMFILTASL
jgi:hypothetical protein